VLAVVVPEAVVPPEVPPLVVTDKVANDTLRLNVKTDTELETGVMLRTKSKPKLLPLMSL